MRTVFLAMLVVICLSGGQCEELSDKPGQKAYIPPAEKVTRIEVVAPAREGDILPPDHAVATIKDRKAIQKIIKALNSLNSGWRRPWDTFPCSQYTISLYSEKKLLAYFWVGEGWLGTRPGKTAANQLRPLDGKPRKELLGLLGVKEAR
jgi:hypothetical protein